MLTSRSLLGYDWCLPRYDSTISTVIQRSSDIVMEFGVSRLVDYGHDFDTTAKACFNPTSSWSYECRFSICFRLVISCTAHDDRFLGNASSSLPHYDLHLENGVVSSTIPSISLRQKHWFTP